MEGHKVEDKMEEEKKTKAGVGGRGQGGKKKSIWKKCIQEI